MSAMSRVVLLAVCLCAGMPASAIGDSLGSGGFSLRSAEVRLVDGVYRIDAVSRLELTPRVRAALEGGVTLTIALEVEIFRTRDWLPDADVAEVVQRHALDLHELSGQYVVTNLNTGERRSFHRLQTALDHIGRGIGFPLIDAVMVGDPTDYYGRVRVRLERESLPWALRPAALFYDDWSLRTEWVQWSFE